MFDVFKGMGMALTMATAKKYELVFKNGIYRIKCDGRCLRIITKYDKSDKEYELRAIKEFDEFIKSQIPIEKSAREKVIKTAYI